MKQIKKQTSKKLKEKNLSPSEVDKILDAMVKAAHASGRVLCRYFEKPIEVREKQGAGLVTQADLESELACVKILKAARPDFRFLTEEATVIAEHNDDREGQPGRWIIDPLDGTTNFVHGFPMFCVSIGAEWNGKIIAGVIYHPILRDTYSAKLGLGAFLNGRRLKVSGTSDLRNALLTTGFSYRKPSANIDQEALAIMHAEMLAFESLSAIARAIRRPGSAALDLAYTARGVFDGFWERRLSAWDVAAGSLLVTEAGGHVTGFSNRKFNVDAGEIIASNGRLHSTLKNKINGERLRKHKK